MVVVSMAIKFYIEIEKAATEKCFKIIWPVIRRTPTHIPLEVRAHSIVFG